LWGQKEVEELQTWVTFRPCALLSFGRMAISNAVVLFQINDKFMGLQRFLINSFILNIYIAPLQGNYSEAFPPTARLKSAILR